MQRVRRVRPNLLDEEFRPQGIDDALACQPLLAMPLGEFKQLPLAQAREKHRIGRLGR